VGKSLSSIDSDGLMICQVANASNEVITVHKKTPIAVISLHLNDKDCVYLTCNGFNIQTARADMNSHEHNDNNDTPTQMTTDCANKSPSPFSRLP